MLPCTSFRRSSSSAWGWKLAFRRFLWESWSSHGHFWVSWVQLMNLAMPDLSLPSWARVIPDWREVTYWWKATLLIASFCEASSIHRADNWLLGWETKGIHGTPRAPMRSDNWGCWIPCKIKNVPSNFRKPQIKSKFLRQIAKETKLIVIMNLQSEENNMQRVSHF